MSRSNQSTDRPSRTVTLNIPRGAASSPLWAASVGPASSTQSRSQIASSNDTTRQSLAGDRSAASVADPISGNATRVDYPPDTYQPSATDATDVGAVTWQDDMATETAFGSPRINAAQNWMKVLTDTHATVRFRGQRQLSQGNSGTLAEPEAAPGSGKTGAPSSSANKKW